MAAEQRGRAVVVALLAGVVLRACAGQPTAGSPLPATRTAACEEARFPVEVLEQESPPLDVVLGDAPGRALRPHVSPKDLREIIVLRRTPLSVVYGIKHGGVVDATARVGRNGAGGWNFIGGGSCLPRLLDRGTHAEPWQLVSPPTPDATALEISYMSGEYCSVTLFDHADVRHTPQTVEVAVYARTTGLIPLGFGCSGAAISRTATVQLGLPVGERTLVDSGFVPPQPVTSLG